MNKQEFLEKWGYTPIEGYGGSLFDFRDHLEKDLDELIIPMKSLPENPIIHSNCIGCELFKWYKEIKHLPF